MAAILTSLMTSNKMANILNNVKHMGIDILPPDINASRDTFTVDKNSIRFGLAAVKNVGENAIKRLMISARKMVLFKIFRGFLFTS